MVKKQLSKRLFSVKIFKNSKIRNIWGSSAGAPRLAADFRKNQSKNAKYPQNIKMQSTPKVSKYVKYHFFLENLQNLVRRFSQNSEVLKRFLESFLVDLEKRCKMSIHLQRSVPIQPRTNPPKFDILILWPSAQIKVKMQVFLLENLQPVFRCSRIDKNPEYR